MSYETSTDRDDEQTQNGQPDPPAMVEGIKQLPGYESLQAHLRPPRSDQRPTKDDVFDILRNRRRRYVLQYLDDHDGVVELSDLAEALANWECDDDDAYITHRDRKRAYVSLYQTHLPKLDRSGIVEYNQPRGTVTLGPDYRYIKEYLHHSHGGALLWHRLYLFGGVSGVGVLGLNRLSVFPFAAVPDVVWFLLVLAVFGTILAAHSLVARSNGTPDSGLLD
ncbi:DUF7344 domain-containing protein [Halalkalicoccus jeotgali]|uniref:DUF7344 domain-containing protein n=1 Tax=Halalkalicoccus jeotgali (strain DSM 18796 / CECT 7217 / JCM 14584 / KCTC 4019 / B3) TaxID=795797 RepID=D8J483_HALJB|nr:hypothetical protein [Halalkalicoccus jeotgali]ADJ15475.1 hypothetical protein HacjB3_10460 [Halalkalicoccus jeotgali B3]ELY36116.1 hypothetical protein C497_12207 [Halalkalicoccus jeotgali B3]